MKKIQISFWESETFLRNPDICIIGGGIVGINAAISLKEKNPKLDVLIVDRNAFPLGASTRNAGFACFGSVTELLDDLGSSNEQAVFQLLADRIAGLNMLRKKVGDKNLHYRHTGSYELFDHGEAKLDDYKAKVEYLNARIFDKVGYRDTFEIRTKLDFPFPGFSNFNIYNKHEGQIHPGKMIETLYDIGSRLGVRFLMGQEIENIEEKDGGVVITSSKYTLQSKYLILCTNGFTQQLIPEIELQPARNQVLVTEEIPELDWESCFHYDRGYVYFRNIGNRILIGGARNIAKERETTSNLEMTDEIIDHLKKFLEERMGITHKVAYQWSGIMGVGNIKNPIVKKQSEHIILAVRLGGMGVALGSLIGEKAANIVLRDNI